MHFIAKQQKFYQISPSRAQEAFQAGGAPFILDKRPYTSSSVQQVMNKRSSGNKHVNTAIAQLYLPGKQSQKPITAIQQPNMDFTQKSQLSQVTPY